MRLCCRRFISRIPTEIWRAWNNCLFVDASRLEIEQLRCGINLFWDSSSRRHFVLFLSIWIFESPFLCHFLHLPHFFFSFYFLLFFLLPLEFFVSSASFQFFYPDYSFHFGVITVRSILIQSSFSNSLFKLFKEMLVLFLLFFYYRRYFFRFFYSFPFYAFHFFIFLIAFKILFTGISVFFIKVFTFSWNIFNNLFFYLCIFWYYFHYRTLLFLDFFLLDFFM